jgi:hypothetical protein
MTSVLRWLETGGKYIKIEFCMATPVRTYGEKLAKLDFMIYLDWVKI